MKLGTLGESLKLEEDSVSVSSVVWLPLAVEFEAASPESLRGSSRAFVRASSGDSCRWEDLRRPRIVLWDVSLLFCGVAIGTGPSAGWVASLDGLALGGLLGQGGLAEASAEAMTGLVCWRLSVLVGHQWLQYTTAKTRRIHYRRFRLGGHAMLRRRV